MQVLAFPCSQFLEQEVKDDAAALLVQSPMGASSGHGFTDRGVQQMEDMLRVHKLALECRIKERIPVESCLMS